MSSEAPLLTCHVWNTSYRHEDGDLISLFYVPALSCAVRYDRTTGFFSAAALALAARGLAKLIANNGHMRLIVGCTLDKDEIEAIEKGYDLRQKIAEKLARTSLEPPDTVARNGLEALAWMIAHERLDVKVAVPVGPSGKPVVTHGIYHEKVGIISDNDGNQISFSGSINETRGGWVDNRESFHVHCSWEGDREAQHVADEVNAFSRLWSDKAASVKTFSFPEAAKQKLLEFLPKDDRFVKPAVKKPDESPVDEKQPTYQLTSDEKRKAVWTFIHNAARMWNGVQVGLITSSVKPWPHQLRTFIRMHAVWPFRLLIADEVGLGKTITAGLLIRQAWLSGMARRILIMAPAGI
ncbi:MAG: helicase, partial [bacterium]